MQTIVNIFNNIVLQPSNLLKDQNLIIPTTKKQNYNYEM